MMTTDSTSPLDPRDIIEQYADSELSDLDAEVSRLLDRQSSGSDSGDESGNSRQEQTEAETHKVPTEVSYRLTSVRRIGVFAAPPHVELTADTAVSGRNPYSSTLASNNRDESSTPIQDDMAGKMTDEAQTTSVRGRGRMASASFKEDTAHTPVTIHSGQIEGDGRIMLSTNNAVPPLSLRENLLLHRLQSDQSLKSAQSDSILGTPPSASSSQLFFDDSDECTPKPLAEELEEADYQKAVDNHLNEVMLDFIGSGDSSSSEFDTSEEESEEEGPESGEQQSSEEEIRLELYESNPSPQRASIAEEKGLSPLLAALTAASQQTRVEGHALTRHDSGNVEQRASKEGFPDIAYESYTNKSDVTAESKVNVGKESGTHRSRGAHPIQKTLNAVPAAGAHTMTRYRDAALHHDAQTAQMIRVNEAEKSTLSLLVPHQQEVGDKASYSTESTEVEPVKPAIVLDQTPNESKVHSSSISNAELPHAPRTKATPLENCVPIELMSGGHCTTKEKSSPHLGAVAGSNHFSSGNESSVTSPCSQVSRADSQIVSQVSVIHQKMPSKGPPTNRPFSKHPTPGKEVQSPFVSNRTQVLEKALVMSNTATSQMKRGEAKCPNDQQSGVPEKGNEGKNKEAQPQKQFVFQFEGQTVTDREASIVSTGSEVLPSATVSNDAHKSVSTSILNTQPPSSQALDPQPPLTTEKAVLRRPLKGILKKKSRFEKGTSTASAESDSTTVTPQASDTSSESSAEKVKTALTESRARQSSLSIVHSLPPFSVEAKVQYFLSSSLVPPLPNEIVPPEMDSERTVNASACGNSSSSTSSSHDDSELNRTLTEEPTVAMHHTPPSSNTHSLGSQPANVLSLEPSDNDATLATSDCEVPHVNVEIALRNEKPLTVNSTASQLRSSPVTTPHPKTITRDTQPAADTNLTLEQLTHTDSEATLPSSDDTTPAKEPDGPHTTFTQAMTPLQGEFTQAMTPLQGEFEGNGSLADKVRALQLRQVKVEKVFAVEREALWDIILQQTQMMASLHRKRRQDQAKLAHMKRHLRLLEGKLEDVEAGVVRIGRATINQQRIGVPGSLSETDLPGLEQMGSLVSKKKLAKLTKFFGDTPPILQQFLERLGYEKYIGKFESAGIGLPELPHVTAEQLKELGVPLGHRTRILKEAKKLA